MKNLFVSLFVSAALMSCVQGGRKTGEFVNMDSLPAPDSVSTLSPSGDDFVVAETMQSATFANFFDVNVDEQGVVRCYFKNTKSPDFAAVFNESCPTDTITVTGSQGRCRGVVVMNMGGGVDPALFMLMEDDHAEYIPLYALSSGKTSTQYRSVQGDITLFEEKELEGDMGGTAVTGIAVDGSKIDLTWEEIVPAPATPTK